MKIVIAVLALMPMLAHAAPSAALDSSRRPLIDRPGPNPPCGDYIDDCGRKPWDDASFSNLRAKTAGLSSAIADGRMDKAGESLNGLFTGAGSKAKGSETSAVSAGAWSLSPRTGAGLLKFEPTTRGGRALRLIEREDGKREAKIIKVSASEKALEYAAGKLADKVIEKGNEVINKYVDRDQTKESIEKYGGCRMKDTCPK